MTKRTSLPNGMISTIKNSTKSPLTHTWPLVKSSISKDMRLESMLESRDLESALSNLVWTIQLRMCGQLKKRSADRTDLAHLWKKWWATGTVNKRKKCKKWRTYNRTLSTAPTKNSEVWEQLLARTIWRVSTKEVIWKVLQVFPVTMTCGRCGNSQVWTHVWVSTMRTRERALLPSASGNENNNLHSFKNLRTIGRCFW